MRHKAYDVWKLNKFGNKADVGIFIITQNKYRSQGGNLKAIYELIILNIQVTFLVKNNAVVLSPGDDGSSSLLAFR